MTIIRDNPLGAALRDYLHPRPLDSGPTVPDDPVQTLGTAKVMTDWNLRSVQTIRELSEQLGALRNENDRLNEEIRVLKRKRRARR